MPALPTTPRPVKINIRQRIQNKKTKICLWQNGCRHCRKILLLAAFCENLTEIISRFVGNVTCFFLRNVI